jgi:hypothetical protein
MGAMAGIIFSCEGVLSEEMNHGAKNGVGGFPYSLYEF